MPTYPIIVERWTGQQSITIACERCHASRVIDADEISSEDIYECPADTKRRRAGLKARCGGTAGMAYVEGERCKNCRKLDYEMPLSGCCSRRCMLQVEYADTLARR